MMEDIVGDYTDKTVTLEDFPHFSTSVKMASIHPCKHSSVMKLLLDRADAALRRRLEKLESDADNPGQAAVAAQQDVPSGMQGLVNDLGNLQVSKAAAAARQKGGVQAAAQGGGGDEWEVLESESGKDKADDDFYDPESAIQVYQYLVVFLKFAASMVPTIEYDQTMSVG